MRRLQLSIPEPTAQSRSVGPQRSIQDTEIRFSCTVISAALPLFERFYEKLRNVSSHLRQLRSEFKNDRLARIGLTLVTVDPVQRAAYPFPDPKRWAD